MKKTVFLLITLVAFGFVNTSVAAPLTYLKIESQIHSGWPNSELHYQWDTDPTEQWSSPIGVSGDQAMLLNNPDKSIAIEVVLGNPIYLYTEAFEGNPLNPEVYKDLFADETYTLTITYNGMDYFIDFKFGETIGDFSITSASTSPFIFEFLGFTDDIDLKELVAHYGLNGGVGLESNDYPDAVYKLTYNVPEPSTVLLLGSALISLCLLGRKRFLRKG